MKSEVTLASLLFPQDPTPSLQHVVRSGFADARSTEVRAQTGGGNDRLLDLDGPVLRRREKAVIALTSVACAHLSMGAEKEQERMAQQAWVWLTTGTARPLDVLDRYYGITPAAALFLLDSLPPDRRETAEEMMPEPAAMLPWIFPELSDTVHSERLLRGTVSLLRQRNGQGEQERWWLNRVTARLARPEKGEQKRNPERERFERLWAMVPEERKRHAAEAFEKTLWDFVEAIRRGCSVYRREVARHSLAILQSLRQIPETDPSMTLYLPPSDIQALRDRSQTDAELMDPLHEETEAWEAAEKAGQSETRLNLMDILPELARLKKLCNNALEGETLFIRNAPLIPLSDLPPEDDETARMAWEEIRSVPVGDPYELCFGFLSLLDAGSDLPWLYGPAILVLLAACRKLPWTASRNRVSSWDGLNPEPDSFRREPPNANLLWAPAPESMSALPRPEDTLEPRYPGSWTGIRLNDPISLAQLVWEATRVVLPRDSTFWREELDRLQAAGFPEDQSAILAFAVRACREAEEPEWFPNLPPAPEPEPEEETPASGEPPVAEQIEEERRRLKELETRCRELQEQLYGVERSLRNRRNETGRLKQTTQAERLELQDLREVLYALLNGTEETEESPATTRSGELPRMLSRTVTVFGGSESWRDELKQLLPEITIRGGDGPIRREHLPRSGAIWLQVRGLSASRYSAILAAAGDAGVPVRMFRCADAARCAEELYAKEGRG